VPTSAKVLFIGSTEPYSGKSAVILGLIDQMQQQGLRISYGKPIGTCLSESPTDDIDEDVKFIAQTSKLAPELLHPSLLSLDTTTIQKRLQGIDTQDYCQQLQTNLQSPISDLILLEGPGTLDEGRLFNLSIRHMAEAVDAQVLVVARYHSVLLADGFMAAQYELGDRLIGVIINDVPDDAEHHQSINHDLIPFLENRGIPVLGLLPSNILLRSVSVGELVNQLDAQVLCRRDRLDLMVESLKIGAMNVSSALKYFQSAINMAIVTGGDRTDIQLAALETSTQCLILTGQLPPATFILNRAEELEIPVLSVELDTLSTVEIIDRAFGQVRLHEPIKVECVKTLMKNHFDLNRLLAQIDLKTALPTG
jgi:uncharacterized protein